MRALLLILILAVLRPIPERFGNHERRLAQLLEPRVLQPVGRRRQRQTRHQLARCRRRCPRRCSARPVPVPRCRARTPAGAHATVRARASARSVMLFCVWPERPGAGRVGAHARAIRRRRGKACRPRSGAARRVRRWRAPPACPSARSRRARCTRSRRPGARERFTVCPVCAMQLAHRRAAPASRTRQPRLHQIAEFRAGACRAGSVPGSDRSTSRHSDHVVQDAVRGGRMQFRVGWQVLSRLTGSRMRGEGVEQAHHAFDHPGSEFWDPGSYRSS